MSDQLEAEVQETVEVVENTETVEAQTDQTSETVSDSGENHEEKPMFSPEQRAAADYAFKAREAKRENEELKRQIAEANQKSGEIQRPEVQELPEYPEPEEIQAFQKATQDAAVWDYQQQQQREASYQATITAQTQQAQEHDNLRNEFVKNSTSAGIKLEDLQMAGNIVDSQGLNPAIAQAMMGDKDGGVVLLHLATDQAAIQALNGANALTLATVYNDIKAKAAALKPKKSGAPLPAEILNGAGSPEKKHPALEGVTYS